MITFSVILAPLNNLSPVFRGQRWILACVFDLIHGVGFAGVLSDLGLPQASQVLSLIGFNVDVELGQMTIVAVFLPFAFMLKTRWVY